MLKFLRRRSKTAKNASAGDGSASNCDDFGNSADGIEVIETNPDPDLSQGSSYFGVTKRQAFLQCIVA